MIGCVRRKLAVLAALAVGLGCMGRKDEADKAAGPEAPAVAAPDEAAFGAVEQSAAEAEPDPRRQRTQSVAAPGAPPRAGGRGGEDMFDDAEEDMAIGGGGPGGESAPATRSWFPETFLFEPRVVTDERGRAEVEVPVPDRLTTWRVLALAHDRAGAQAGAVTSFLGTLPVYVDPVVPPALRVGDVARIPIQIVNTGDAPVTGALSLSADGARIAAAPGGAGAVTVPSGGSAVRYAIVTAERPGAARVLARFGDADQVVRSIEILPTGRRVDHERGGTLAAPRSLEVKGTTGAAPSYARVRLVVFPGALALLRSELASARARHGPADDAFALLLAGRAPALLSALGDEPDRAALRDLTILATQVAVRRARVLTADSAALYAEAALAHPDDPVLSRLGRRAVAWLRDNQVPDGTCGGESGWTLQRLLVATAECARAARDEREVVIRASGAFERHADQINDPYTAAAVLASGGVSGALAEALRKQVLEAIVPGLDGARRLEVPAGVVRSDGLAPGRVEATALAILALDGPGADAELLADLGATLLGAYSPGRGWGDGRANLVCMEAAARLFRDPLPDRVRVVLTMDGEVVAEGELGRERVREALVLERPGIDARGERRFEVRADPPLPGLGFALTVSAWQPWPARPTGELELVAAAPSSLRVGAPATLRVQANPPADHALALELELPAGVQVDRAELDRQVDAGDLTSYRLTDTALAIHVPPVDPGQALSVTVRVIPTLGGALQSGPARLRVGQREVSAPPATWTIP